MVILSDIKKLQKCEDRIRVPVTRTTPTGTITYFPTTVAAFIGPGGYPENHHQYHFSECAHIVAKCTKCKISPFWEMRYQHKCQLCGCSPCKFPTSYHRYHLLYGICEKCLAFMRVSPQEWTEMVENKSFKEVNTIWLEWCKRYNEEQFQLRRSEERIVIALGVIASIGLAAVGICVIGKCWKSIVEDWYTEY